MLAQGVGQTDLAFEGEGVVRALAVFDTTRGTPVCWADTLAQVKGQ
jgi:hypothetical protein